MPPSTNNVIIIRHLGREPYTDTYARMQAFTAARDAATPDEFWLLEHDPVYTLGTNAMAEHVLQAGDIPVIRVDRGGQVTYHGPGQLMVYVMLDLQRARIGVRDLICRLERSVISSLADCGILAATRPGAPGVYVAGAKIASVGLRVRRNRCYHGLALNVNPDLEPFSRINPCGYKGLAVTSTARLGGPDSVQNMAAQLSAALLQQLNAEAGPDPY